MKIIGLTGGIGMGKSTAAAAFRRAHLPVFDADAAVHRLQARGGRAVPAIAAAFPGVVVAGAVDRRLLRAAAIQSPAAMTTLERILHPMVRAEERRFLAAARRARARAAVLDIPLLLETGGARRVDLVVVVSAPAAVQRARVRKRARMTDAQTAAIVARQMPDREKRRRANVVVQTGLSRNHANRRLQRLIQRLWANKRPRPKHSTSATPTALLPLPRGLGRKADQGRGEGPATSPPSPSPSVRGVGQGSHRQHPFLPLPRGEGRGEGPNTSTHPHP